MEDEFEGVVSEGDIETQPKEEESEPVGPWSLYVTVGLLLLVGVLLVLQRRKDWFKKRRIPFSSWVKATPTELQNDVTQFYLKHTETIQKYARIQQNEHGRGVVVVDVSTELEKGAPQDKVRLLFIAFRDFDDPRFGIINSQIKEEVRRYDPRKSALLLFTNTMDYFYHGRPDRILPFVAIPFETTSKKKH